MKDHAAASVSDEEFTKRAEKWPIDTPDTKEGYYIRQTFASMTQYLWAGSILHSFDTFPCVLSFAGLFPSEAAAKTAVRYVITLSTHVWGAASCSLLMPNVSLDGYHEGIGGARLIQAVAVSTSTTLHTLNDQPPTRRCTRGQRTILFANLRAGNCIPPQWFIEQLDHYYDRQGPAHLYQNERHWICKDREMIEMIEMRADLRY